MITRQNPVVLIGEDDPADRDLIRRALSKGSINFELVCDGAEIIDYIECSTDFDSQTSKPDLIIVDLNMPRLNGRQVLEHIRSNMRDLKIPVVIFSSSNRASDIRDCYDAGCSSYVVKPTDLEPFVGAVNLVVAYWLELVEPASFDL